MEEILQKRTENSKTFDLGNGQKRLESHIAPIHYHDDNGVLQDIDGTLITDTSVVGFNVGCETLPIPIKIDTVTGKRRLYPVRTDRSKYIEFSGLSGLSGGVRSGNTITWDKINFKLVFTLGRYIKFDYTLKNLNAPKTITFGLTLVGLTYNHASGEIRNNGVAVAWIRKPFAIDANKVRRNLTFGYSAGNLTMTLDDTGLVYPIVVDPSIAPYSTTGDGFVQSDVTSGDSWTTRLDAASGNEFTTTASAFEVMTRILTNRKTIQRVLAGIFDTSAIPDDATIDSAVFSIYAVGATGTGRAGILCTTSLTAITANSDYAKANWGETSAGSVPQSPSTIAYTDITVNTAVITISKTGTTYIGIRGINDYPDGSAPADGNNYTQWYSANATGTANDPYLTVNYTEAASGVGGLLLTGVGA